MSTNTGIAWTDATWNPVVGCEKVSQGCKFCYAKQLHDQRHKAHLSGHAVAVQYHVPFETIQLKPERLTHPLSWRKPRRVFVNSVSDLFHDDVPDAFIENVFAVMTLARHHTFQILTKRPERMQRLLSSDNFRECVCSRVNRPDVWPDRAVAAFQIDPVAWPIPNVWLGVSVENQAAADERIPLLLDTPAAIRFLSCEPLLGPIDFYGAGSRGSEDGDPFAFSALRGADGVEPPIPGIDWVIVGGESGPKHRPMEIDWLESIVRQCDDAGTAVFVKQDSGPRSGMQGRIPSDAWVYKEFPEGAR